MGPQGDFDKTQQAWRRALQAAGQHGLVLEGQGAHQCDKLTGLRGHGKGTDFDTQEQTTARIGRHSCSRTGSLVTGLSGPPLSEYEGRGDQALVASGPCWRPSPRQ